MLKSIFINLVITYCNNDTAQKLWAEVEKAYSYKKRYYHNLNHLEKVYTELKHCKIQIDDWDTVLFALFYHDIIYKATRNDNEEQSAELAEKRLKEINYPAEKTARCKQHILATKSHLPCSDNDTNLFTDADLAILGYPLKEYMAYSRQVRKEFSYYPNILYKPGRKKVLLHFLEMSYIYKTGFFQQKYEEPARENIRQELTKL